MTTLTPPHDIRELAVARQQLEDQLFPRTMEVMASGVRSLVGQGVVVGVAIGSAPPDTEDTYALNVYLSDESAQGLAPERFEGLPVVSEIVGVFKAAAVRAEGNTLNLPVTTVDPSRPVAGGVSIGSVRLGAPAGTLGCLVRDHAGRVGVLSCSHILALTGSAPIPDLHVSVGDAILQPAPSDGGTLAGSKLAALGPGSWTTIDFATDSTNLADAAVAYLVNPDDCYPFILGIGELRGEVDLTLRSDTGLGQWVRKTGRSTGRTAARVAAIVGSVFVEYTIPGTVLEKLPISSAKLTNQFILGPSDTSTPDLVFAKGGDSGAIVVADGNLAMGLLCAVTTTETGQTRALVNPITAVLNELQVQLSTVAW